MLEDWMAGGVISATFNQFYENQAARSGVSDSSSRVWKGGP